MIIKKVTAIIMVSILMLFTVSCGGSDDEGKEPERVEIAMIADSDEIKDGSFTEATWECVEQFATGNGMVAECYKTEEVVSPEEAAQEEAKKGGEDAGKKAPATKEESYMNAIKEAVDDEAKIIIMDGGNFETAVYTAQAQYTDVYFLLIDGVPHDAAMNYATAANTISIIFAEEEAGYLAGYAAVKDGFTKLGFMGGQELPGVKRYGYGFVQGAAAAADELEKKVEMSYIYTGTFEPTKEIRQQAADWYKNGTEIIFACGGGMGTAVMKAAEKNSGKVIGVDVDQSGLSGTVVTSAKKEISIAVTEMLENYADDKFVGGTAFNYTAKNKGVDLEMENAQFRTFTEKEYKNVLKQLQNGKIQLKKDTGVNAVTELTGEWVTIK